MLWWLPVFHPRNIWLNLRRPIKQRVTAGNTHVSIFLWSDELPFIYRTKYFGFCFLVLSFILSPTESLLLSYDRGYNSNLLAIVYISGRKHGRKNLWLDQNNRVLALSHPELFREIHRNPLGWSSFVKDSSGIFRTWRTSGWWWKVEKS